MVRRGKGGKALPDRLKAQSVSLIVKVYRFPSRTCREASGRHSAFELTAVVAPSDVRVSDVTEHHPLEGPRFRMVPVTGVQFW